MLKCCNVNNVRESRCDLNLKQLVQVVSVQGWHKRNWGEFWRILFASSTWKRLRCGCLRDSDQRHLIAEEETTATGKRKRAEIRSWFLAWNKHQMMLGCGKHFFILIYQLIANKVDFPTGNSDTRQFSILVRSLFWRCKLKLLNTDIY